MIYKVTKQFSAGGGKEQPLRQFKSLAEAKSFASESAEGDAVMKIQAVYRVYEFDDLLATIDSNNIQPTSKSSDAGGSQGMGSGARFSPTPLEMSPRPKGTAPRVWSEDKDDKNKDK